MNLVLTAITGLFLSSILTLLFGKKYYSLIFLCLIFTFVNLVLSFYAFSIPDQAISFPWFNMGKIAIEFTLKIDPLAAFMYFLVSCISFLVQIYSLEYMKVDSRKHSYFAFLGFFTFAMLGLILSADFLSIFFFWELVGVSSYLLIGFWYEKNEAANAAKKAFLTTKIGDLGFLLALLLIFYYFKTFEFKSIAVMGGNYESFKAFGLISLLLLMAAIGKSAQFPLQTWLPGAMAGPTPVSALIHAATMVAAGIYLVSRVYFLFTPFTLEVMLIVGVLTALIGSFAALSQLEIKKILAYSTISQLGFMMSALGAGSVYAAIFHLGTHAFFKSLLFLSAGSITLNFNKTSIEEFKKAKIKMPITQKVFLIGLLALSGIPPLSGFFSKEEVLSAVYLANRFYFIALILATFLTAFYSFRLYFSIFKKEQKETKESGKLITIPLMVLSIFSIFSGMIFFPEILDVFLKSAKHQNKMIILISGLLSAFLGIFFAYIVYRRKLYILKMPELLKNLSLKGFYFDEIYSKLIIIPIDFLAEKVKLIDELIIHGTIKLIRKATCILSGSGHLTDEKVIDKVVNLSGKLLIREANVLKIMQSGNLRTYLYIFIFGFLFFILVF